MHPVSALSNTAFLHLKCELHLARFNNLVNMLQSPTLASFFPHKRRGEDKFASIPDRVIKMTLLKVSPE